MTLPALILVLPAQAESLRLSGKFGYLQEYELSADVSAKDSSESKAFSGAMTVKHVGLCSHDGPDQVEGTIGLQFGGAGRVKATLVFAGHTCTFSGKLSQAGDGELVCAGATVPFSMWSR
jgi:hypothetical protein